MALNVRQAVKLETEHASDLDRVLNIFARTNTGGTQLTYVELLVSTATARWRKLDAAKEIGELRQKMNTASP